MFEELHIGCLIGEKDPAAAGSLKSRRPVPLPGCAFRDGQIDAELGGNQELHHPRELRASEEAYRIEQLRDGVVIATYEA